MTKLPSKLPSEYKSIFFLEFPVKIQLKGYPESWYEMAEDCGVTVEQIAESKGETAKSTYSDTSIWLCREMVEGIGAIRDTNDGCCVVDLDTDESMYVFAPAEELVSYIDGFLMMAYTDGEDDDEPEVNKKTKEKIKKNEE